MNRFRLSVTMSKFCSCDQGSADRTQYVYQLRLPATRRNTERTNCVPLPLTDPNIGMLNFTDISVKSKSLSLSDRSEKLHFFFYCLLYSFGSGREQFSRVKSFALKILACLNVGSCSRLERKLTFGIYIDF